MSLSDNAGYSSNNVLCIDYNSSSTYQLKGCPTFFFNSIQDPIGVCRNTTDNGTDLVLTAKKLKPGHDSYDCSNTTAPNGMVSSIAIVG